jgi:hypothetical protein
MGCRKRVLASAIVDILVEPEVTVAKFFCVYNYEIQERKDVSKVLKALLHQILHNKWLLRQHALPVWTRMKEQKPVWPLDTLLCGLKDVMQDVGHPVYFIIDALDHCNEQLQVQIWDAVSQILAAPGATFKVLITCSPHFKLPDRAMDDLQIQIQPENVTDDIGTTMAPEARKLPYQLPFTQVGNLTNGSRIAL